MFTTRKVHLQPFFMSGTSEKTSTNQLFSSFNVKYNFCILAYQYVKKIMLKSVY